MLIHKPDFHTYEEQSFSVGSCTLKIREHSSDIIHGNGNRYSITIKEGEVLKNLLLSHKEVCTKDELIRAAWGNPEAIGSNSLPVAISNLRKVLEPESIKIVNVPKKGYKLSFSETSNTEHKIKGHPKSSDAPSMDSAPLSHDREPIKMSLARKLFAFFSAATTLLILTYTAFSWVSVSCSIDNGTRVCAIDGVQQGYAAFSTKKGTTVYISSNGKRYEVANDN
ncbi:winged helix-turn-helix domain-containing protein [Vibrio coralliilyticus]|uniref:winged helix-turn-helix domain-containing protein n=1 Tax=Vibrio coralliilyticus TaxID=190893 RepID=UPI001E36AA41|nr:winged helix-turn-helix domain-containing protein [Vibrio coralliilyticus]MCC2525794.1 winged helix-turn-helix domain-containing protein [Vibrio coralliilyticus]